MVLYKYVSQPIRSYCMASKKISTFRPQSCQFCRGTKFHGHGWRRRYVHHDGQDRQILIQRFKCCNCSRTVTILPSFLTRKFIRSVDNILSQVRSSFQSLKNTVGRQISAFYRKRFLRYLSPLIMLLNCHGKHLLLPENENEKAIKVIETAQVQFPNSLSESFFWNTNKHFMAF